MVGVGGVVIQDGRALLIRRGTEPLKGEWSIPGGMLELGETLVAGVERELLEETGLKVRVIELIEIFERISHAERERRRCKTEFTAAISFCDCGLSLRSCERRGDCGQRRDGFGICC